jgi:opacity protein-like surface antigen
MKGKRGKINLKILIIFITALTLHISFASQKVFGGDFVEDQQGSQGDNSDSSFDPFSDYSEFEEGSEEESDVNFFHNGRFLTVGLLGGYETYTGTYAQLYKPTFGYGVFISYFFDLRFSMQVAYVSADHALDIIDGRTSTEIQGKATLSRFEFDLKYYFNTQNVTKGLSWINPYLLVGMSNYTRTLSYTNTQGYARDTAFGFQAGGGLEFPIMHNHMFFGAQGLYNYVSFPDRGSPVQFSNGTNTGITLQGDILTFMGLLGFNF